MGTQLSLFSNPPPPHIHPVTPLPPPATKKSSSSSFPLTFFYLYVSHSFSPRQPLFLNYGSFPIKSVNVSTTREFPQFFFFLNLPKLQDAFFFHNIIPLDKVIPPVQRAGCTDPLSYRLQYTQDRQYIYSSTTSETPLPPTLQPSQAEITTSTLLHCHSLFSLVARHYSIPE